MTKCNLCKKKILMEFNCKCGGIFCLDCRNSDKHNCQFNYLEYNKKELNTKLEKVVANKINIF